MNDVLTRLLVLRKIIKAGSENLPWCGNIAMQKLVYLLEHVYGTNIGYTYGLHQLGPYSHELATDLSLGEQSHLWDSKTVHAFSVTNSFSGKQYDVRDDVDQPPHARSASEAEWRRVAPSLNLLVNAIRNRTSRDLELYATIHYLRTVQEVPDEELWEVLHALKPKYSQGEFEAGKRKLREMEQGEAGHPPVASISV